MLKIFVCRNKFWSTTNIFEADETNESLSLTLSVCIGHIMTIEASKQQQCIFFILSFCLYADTKTNANTCIKLFFYSAAAAALRSLRFVQLMWILVRRCIHSTLRAIAEYRQTLQYWFFFCISFFSAVVDMFLIFHLPPLWELFGKCNDDDDERERENFYYFWLTNIFFSSALFCRVVDINFLLFLSKMESNWYEKL